MISDNSYLWVWRLERNETLDIHVQHGKSLQRVQSWSHRRRQSCWMWRMLGQKVRSTRHNAVRHDGQLVTPFYAVTSWPCDELTGSRNVRSREETIMHSKNSRNNENSDLLKTPDSEHSIDIRRRLMCLMYICRCFPCCCCIPGESWVMLVVCIGWTGW